MGGLEPPLATLLLLRTVQATGKFFEKFKKSRFFGFAILRCCKSSIKVLLKQTEHWKLDNFTNMVAESEIEALKFKNK